MAISYKFVQFDLYKNENACLKKKKSQDSIPKANHQIV